jgi:3-hydroxyacyl-CoA dehydrogenase
VGGTGVVIPTQNGGYPVVVYNRDHEKEEKQTVQCAKAANLAWEIDQKSFTEEEKKLLKKYDDEQENYNEDDDDDDVDDIDQP